MPVPEVLVHITEGLEVFYVNIVYLISCCEVCQFDLQFFDSLLCVFYLHVLGQEVVRDEAMLTASLVVISSIMISRLSLHKREIQILYS